MKVSNVHYLIRFVKCEVKKIIFSIREMRIIFFTTIERCFCKRKICFSFYLFINTKAAFLHTKRYLAVLIRSIFLCSTSRFSENLQFLSPSKQTSLCCNFKTRISWTILNKVIKVNTP